MLTWSDFIAFYPQFSAFLPRTVADEYIRQANGRFSEFEDDTMEARRLYVAHKLTLYAKAALPAGTASSMSVIAQSGETEQQIISKRVGEVSVGYATRKSSASASETAFGDLLDTVYGQQLVSLIRLHSFEMYVP